MACQPTFKGKFVNTYLTDRAYGGPEEGGWWYGCGEAVRSVQVDDAQAEIVAQGERTRCGKLNSERRSDVNSVLSEGCYVVSIEDEPAQDYPKERPHYE